MKTMRWVAAAAMMLCVNVQAQERTAGGVVDTQMTWSSLSTQINSVKLQTEAVNTRVDQVVVCAKKGLVYAPGTPGIDADGCLLATTSPAVVTSINTLNINTQTINNNLKTLTTANSTNTTQVNNILGCSQQGKLFNGTACAAAGGNASCHLTSHTGSCKSGEVAISALQNQHVGGGNSPNGTGFESTGTATYCLAVACN